MTRTLLPFSRSASSHTGRDLSTIAAICTVVLLVATPALAQKVPSGPEFQVNTYTLGGQGRFNGPRVASAADGSFVVAWEDNGDYKMAARQFDASSQPRGPEIVVANVAYEYNPDVASDASGNFIVVWGDYYAFARRYDSTGAALGPAFQVNTTPYAFNVKVAASPAGDFVVVWAAYDDGYHIRAQRFASAGTTLGAEFQVNTYTTFCCGYSIIDEDRDAIEVAADPAGNFMIVWSRGQSESTLAVAGRTFDSAGTAGGPDFVVNVDLPDYYTNVDVAADGAGRFVVVWEGDFPYGVRARRFDTSGSPLGGEFMINADVGYGHAPAVAADADGNFSVVWTDWYGTAGRCREPGPACDGSSNGVFGRQFDSDGNPLGPDFVINTYTFDYQTLPDIAAAPNGDFVVVWESYYQDGDDFGIFGQRFADSGPAGCSLSPKQACRQSTQAGKGVLLLKDKSPDTRDRVSWKWRKGSATDVFDFGEPLTHTDYALCIYDASTNAQPVLTARAPAGGDCPGRPCWKLQGGAKRIEYKNKDLDPDGLQSLVLKAGEDGKAQVKANAKGEDIDMPALPLLPPVLVQLQGEHGECWEATYSDLVLKNDESGFRAKPDLPLSPSAAFLDDRARVLD
jgi:hypothetical protein